MAEGISYEGLGGFDGITAVAAALRVPLFHDPSLERFWCHQSGDTPAREKSLHIGFLVSATGGAACSVGEAMRRRLGDSTSSQPRTHKKPLSRASISSKNVRAGYAHARPFTRGGRVA